MRFDEQRFLDELDELETPNPTRQARQPQELVDDRVLVRHRAADRLLVRGAGVSPDELEVSLQLRPAGEAETARNHQQSVGTREAFELRRAGLNVMQTRMELAHHLRRTRIARSDSALERLGALL